MSAKPCGCDAEESYVCRVHTEALEKAVDAFVPPEYEDATDVEELPRTFNVAPEFIAERDRSMDAYMQTEEFKRGRAAGLKALEESMHADEVTTRLDARFWKSAMEERAIVVRVTEVLATFYLAPLSMSSVAPILALAEELNPGLKETK